MSDLRIEEAIKQTGAKLVILDPIQAYLGSGVDMHRANEIRPVMKHLGDIAEKYKLCNHPYRAYEQSKR